MPEAERHALFPILEDDYRQQVNMPDGLRVHDEGIGVVDVFWSLWLIPFGLLVYRSGPLPRTLGILLVAGATGAMIGAVTSVLPFLSNGIVNKVGQVLALGELPIIVWLVVPGARESASKGPGLSVL